jgi:hypothetical protein
MQPTMASAIAERQDALVDVMAAAKLDYPQLAAGGFSWRRLADALDERPREAASPPAASR